MVYLLYYPNATSSIIIIINPNAKQIVPKSDSSPDDDSGINSSTTTYIIAPAAKVNKYGINGRINCENITVNNAAIGSTTPDKNPQENDLNLLIPLPLSGIEIIAPSGKF